MYAKLNEIYDKTQTAVFVCGITYLIEKGMENVVQITDEQIAEVKGNGLMTDGFCQAIIKVAKKIAESVESSVEIIQFADAKGLFETEYYTNGEVFRRSTLEEIVRKLLVDAYEDKQYGGSTDDEALEKIAEYLELETEDIERLCGWA
jgi:hypothetical protein